MATANYLFSLISVERQTGADIPAGNSAVQYQKTAEVGISGLSFDDGMIAVAWKPTPVAFTLQVRNQTEAPAMVRWDETRLVDWNGISQRMLHTGYGYQERNLSQPASLIPAGGVLDDFMHPAGNFEVKKIPGVDSDRRSTYWIRTPFMPERLETGPEKKDPKAPPLKPEALANTLRDRAQPFVGKTIRILLPLEIGGTRIDYLSTFRIEGVTVAVSQINEFPEGDPLKAQPDQEGRERVPRRHDLPDPSPR